MEAPYPAFAQGTIDAPTIWRKSADDWPTKWIPLTMQKNLDKLAKKKAAIAAEIRAVKRAQKRTEMEARRREIAVMVDRAIRGGATIEQVSAALAQIGTHPALKAEPQLAP